MKLGFIQLIYNEEKWKNKNTNSYQIIVTFKTKHSTSSILLKQSQMKQIYEQSTFSYLHEQQE